MREVTFYEKALVGAILNDASTMELVGDHLANHAFIDPVCGIAFVIAFELRAKGCNTSPNDVIRRAIETDRDREVDFVELNRLANESCIRSSIAYYLDELLKLDSRRSAQVAMAVASEMLTRDDVELDSVFAYIESCRLKVKSSQLTRVSIQDAVRRVAEEARQERVAKAVPCNIGRLDNILGGGFHVGELSIVAARPSVGKTSFAAQAAFNMAEKHPVLFVSLEMSSDDIARRYIAHLGGPTFNQMRGHISSDDFASCIRVPVQGRSLFLSESKSGSLSSIIAQVRSAKASCGIKAVVIDYLGFVTHDRRMKRWEEVGVITKELKQLANTEQVAMIILSQLTREIDSSKRPQLSHLRESGSVEQDADVVLFLYRESEDGSDRIIEVAKNRNGELLATKMEFVGERFRFVEPSNEWKPGA